MALILAIEPDRRQAARLTSLIRARVGAHLVLAETTEQALGAIGDRVPDLILIPALLAPQDDAALAAALRVIATAAHVQMLTIPVLAAASQRNQPRSLLARWRRAEPAASDGCDPAMFGDQIAAYLAEAAAQRAGDETALPLPGDISTDEARPAADPVVEELPAVACAMEETPVAVEDLLIAELVAEESVLATAIEQAAADPVVEALPAVAYAMEETPVVLVEEPPIAELVADESVLAPAIEQAAADPVVEELPAVAYAMEETPVVVVAESPIAELVAEDLTAAVDAACITSLEEPTVYELQVDDASAGRLDLWTLPSFGPQHGVVRPSADLSMADVTVEDERDDDSDSIDTDWFEEPAPVVRVELWMPLSFGASRTWPNLDGVLAEAQEEAVMEEAEAAFVAAAPAPVPATAQIAHAAAPEAPPKPDWSELIASLRQDVQRLRTDRSHPAPSVVRREEQSPPPLASSQHPAAVADILTRARKSAAPTKPAQDEWGLFDPEQCGFAALLAKLDEITHGNDESSARSA